jgi:hypothetical protein
MNSPWVKTELRKALAKEKHANKRVLFPIGLVPFDIIHGWECFKYRHRHRRRGVPVGPEIGTRRPEQRARKSPHHPVHRNQTGPSGAPKLFILNMRMYFIVFKKSNLQVGNEKGFLSFAAEKSWRKSVLLKAAKVRKPRSELNPGRHAELEWVLFDDGARRDGLGERCLWDCVMAEGKVVDMVSPHALEDG